MLKQRFDIRTLFQIFALGVFIFQLQNSVRKYIKGETLYRGVIIESKYSLLKCFRSLLTNGSFILQTSPTMKNKKETRFQHIYNLNPFVFLKDKLNLKI